jgi:PKD repeat protein
VIGGLVAGKDSNNDGWISFLEDFAFAKPSTEQNFLDPRDPKQYPVSYNGLPNQDDPHLALIANPPVVNIDNFPKIAWPNETVAFNASNSYGSIATYRWDFGDGTIIEITEPSANHIFTTEGNYIVTLNVTDIYGRWNATSTRITVTFNTDLNKDGTVNILDVTIVAASYNTKSDDPKWNALADLDKSGLVNILDISMIARNYGKTV